MVKKKKSTTSLICGGCGKKLGVGDTADNREKFWNIHIEACIERNGIQYDPETDVPIIKWIAERWKKERAKPANPRPSLTIGIAHAKKAKRTNPVVKRVKRAVKQATLDESDHDAALEAMVERIRLLQERTAQILGE